jgi:glycosyltransferase involved in cell wall biosynthesis
MPEPEYPVELSIVIPVWNERENIAPLVLEIQASSLKVPFEVIFVDDGSHDGTFTKIAACHREDPRIKGVLLKQHAGKSAAYLAGFRQARGRLVATMDGDLQDDPKDLVPLLNKLEEGSDLVIGWKQTGKSSRSTFALSRILNGLLRRMTGLPLHDMNCPLRVMKASVAKKLDLRADLHRYIPLLAKSMGASVAEVPVGNRERLHGVSKYTGSKYWNSAISYMGLRLYLRFGERPMFLFGSLGLLCFLLGAAVIAKVVIGFVAFSTDIDDDLPTLVLGVLLTLVGTQFLGLGLLGEILVRRLSHHEARGADAVQEVLGA